MGLIPVPSLTHPGGLALCQDAEQSCSHLGTMVEFAVALGSKLDVINKHSFNNFRLRVGEDPPFLGQFGTSFSASQALPPPSPLLAAPQLIPGNPCRLTPWDGA